MKKVPRHKVLVAELKQDWFLHTTQKAIYSTLTNRTIKAELNEGGSVKLYIEKDKEIRVLTSKKNPKDKKEKVDFKFGGKRALFSPASSKMKPPRLELEHKVFIGKSLTFSNSEEKTDQEAKSSKEKPKKKRRALPYPPKETEEKERVHKKAKRKKEKE